jgi:TRAP-type C4-dicarboxylate transport system permease small subunit
MLLFQWVAFLGAAVGVKRMRHFGIELLVRNLSEKARHRIELLVPPLMAVLAITMVTEGIKLINVNRFRVYSSMDLSYVWPFLAIPVSGCLILLYLLLNEIRRWRGGEKGEHEG